MAITINGTTGISGVDGSAATPALQGADTNTGISFGTDTVTINTGGVARVTTDASGNVGIGAVSPLRPLHIEGTGTLGTQLLVKSGSAAGFQLTSDAGKTYEIQSNSASALIFYDRTSSAERMRIDSSGNLLVGVTGLTSGMPNASGMYVQVAEGAIKLRAGVANTVMQFAHVGGTAVVGNISVTASSTSYNTSSDYRLKEQVAPMTGALAKNELLNPVTYKWKSDGSDGQGFIAHELQAVFPDAVTGEKDAVDDEGSPKYQGVDTSFLVGHLVACVKELKAELDSVKAELATLKGAA